MHILITRPEPDASCWRSEFEARGIACSVDPLLNVIDVCPTALPTDGLAAVIATSRNALRPLLSHPARATLAALPLYAVGPGTAALAHACGFADIRTGPAAGAGLAALIASNRPRQAGRLLHLTGDKLAFDLAAALAPHGLAVDRLIVYETRPASALRPSTIAGLSTGPIDTVLLMSPLSARTFLALAADAGLTQRLHAHRALCLSPAIAEIAKKGGFRHSDIAAAPNSAAVFTLAADLARAG